MEKILLPRNYLSYSAWHLWKTSQKRFRQEYFEKGPKLDTKYYRFGKEIAQMIEDGSYKNILPNLRVYPHREYEVRTMVQNVPILAYLDGWEDDEIGEYKTGMYSKKGLPAWTQTKVQKHEQLTYYAVAKRAETGKMPHRAVLHWIVSQETESNVESTFFSNESKLSVTGEIISFVREFDKRELDRMEKDIVEVAQQISKAYKEFIDEI